MIVANAMSIDIPRMMISAVSSRFFVSGKESSNVRINRFSGSVVFHRMNANILTMVIKRKSERRIVSNRIPHGV